MPDSPKKLNDSITRLEKNTKKTLEQWMDLVRRKGPKDRRECIQWLRVNYNLDSRQAGTILKMMNEGLKDYDEKELTKHHYSKGREYLKPVYEKLIQSAGKWGKFNIIVNKTYLSLVNSGQFAILKFTKNGLIVGVPSSAVKSAKSKDFTATKNFGNEKITHRITLLDESDLNDSVMKVLKAAYRKF